MALVGVCKGRLVMLAATTASTHQLEPTKARQPESTKAVPVALPLLG